MRFEQSYRNVAFTSECANCTKLLNQTPPLTIEFGSTHQRGCSICKHVFVLNLMYLDTPLNQMPLGHLKRTAVMQSYAAHIPIEGAMVRLRKTFLFSQAFKDFPMRPQMSKCQSNFLASSTHISKNYFCWR